MSRTYSEDQVRAIAYAYYTAGRYSADVAELHAIWGAYNEPRATWEQRVARRIKEMETWARRRAERAGRTYREYHGGPIDWETGEPVRALRAAA